MKAVAGGAKPPQRKDAPAAGVVGLPENVPLERVVGTLHPLTNKPGELFESGIGHKLTDLSQDAMLVYTDKAGTSLLGFDGVSQSAFISDVDHNLDAGKVKEHRELLLNALAERVPQIQADTANYPYGADDATFGFVSSPREFSKN